MKRRTFTALGGTVLLAGCIGGGDDALFDSDVAAGEGELYSSFGASEGDELRVTISAGENGANTGLSATQLNGIDEGVNWWGWALEVNEEISDTIEIVKDDDYTVWINEGQAHVTIESA